MYLYSVCMQYFSPIGSKGIKFSSYYALSSVSRTTWIYIYFKKKKTIVLHFYNLSYSNSYCENCRDCLVLKSLCSLSVHLIHPKIDREKNSPFECGFDPKGSARLPFSLRFFLIAVIFLIFDVEITLLLPLAMIINFSNISAWAFTGFVFIIILLVGLYHEWNQGALEWAYWSYSQQWHLICTQKVLH